MIYNLTTDGFHSYSFDGVEDLITEGRKAGGSNLSIVNRHAINRQDFIGRQFPGWESADRTALEPWAEGQMIVDRMVTALEAVDLPKPKSRKRKMRFDEADGDELDLDRLRDGQPFWRRARRETLSGPQTVVLCVDIGGLSEVSHQDLLWRGAAAIATTHILEEAGFRVELWAVNKARGVYANGDGFLFAVNLKRAGDPLDSATLVSAVSGWFFRSQVFRVRALTPLAVERSLGASCIPYQSDLQSLTGSDDPILIAGATSEWGATEVARQVLQTLADSQLPPEPEPLTNPEPVEVALPAEPPKPLTKAELKAQAAEQRRADREYRKWAKAWAARQRDI